MPQPSNLKLYEKIKKKVYKEIPKHSAYRSGVVVQKYKTAFKKKYGTTNQPYLGKYTKKKGLRRWFDEKWVKQRGTIGDKYKSDIYRPSKRITSKTPITHKELSKKEIKRAKNEKYTKGRVKRFKPKTRKILKGRKNALTFEDYPEFAPNLSPRDIFKLGSFGGTYWRPIYSSVNKKKYKNVHHQYPKQWWKNIPETHLSQPNYDTQLNKYKVKVGTSLEFWESKQWINPKQPYGWVHWYCDFYNGKRGEDDERQIKRWKALAGPKGRFMRFLVTQILKKKGKWNDETISPKIRQVLQHWGYVLTKKDFDHELKRRNI